MTAPPEPRTPPPLSEKVMVVPVVSVKVSPNHVLFACLGVLTPRTRVDITDFTSTDNS